MMRHAFNVFAGLVGAALALSVDPARTSPVSVNAAAQTDSSAALVFRGPIGEGPEWEAFVRRVLERIREDQRGGVPTDLEQGLLAPPPDDPEPRSASWRRLADIVASMEAFLTPELLPPGFARGRGEGWGLFLAGRLPLPALSAPSASPFEALGRQSIVEAHRAVSKLVQVDADVPRALDHILRSIEQITRAREQTDTRGEITFANSTLLELLGAGELLAQESIERATSGGVDPRTVAGAEQALADGLAAISDGLYREAMIAFAAVIPVGELPRFDLDRFVQNLRMRLDDDTIGYSYATAMNGQLVRSGSNGFARTAVDGAVAQSSAKKMNIASMSKTVTAMTLLQILFEKNISVDSSIQPWLPASWSKGPGIVSLTFRDLLTHRSGLGANQNGPSSFFWLRSYVEAGIDPADKAVYEYQNANYQLFRILIAFLHVGPAVLNAFDAIGYDLDPMTATFYKTIVRERVLANAGVEADCRPPNPSGTQTLTYSFLDPGGPGLSWGDGTYWCAGGGWHFSAIELARLLSVRRFTSWILSPTARQAMDLGFLGWAPGDAAEGIGKHGIYRHHGGYLGSSDTPSRGMSSCWMEFPNGVQAAFLVNSLNNGFKHCGQLRNSFDSAWVTP